MREMLVGTRTVPLPETAADDQILPLFRREEVLVIGAAAQAAARQAVDKAAAAFSALARVSPEAISNFYRGFAAGIRNDAAWAQVAAANREDVARAQSRGRPIGRLALNDGMRAAMAEGLEGWAMAPHRVGEVLEVREAETFRIERRRAPLGLVAFVFEGRPNVFADGAGVLRSGNCAVMRIGQDAQGTAEAMMRVILAPALRDSGLPEGAITLVESRDRAAGQALFADTRLRLAVARGSGQAVSTLGAIAEQHGIPVSLHGTGGAWMYLAADARLPVALAAVRSSLDRKVCNTLNTLVFDAGLSQAFRGKIVELLEQLGAKVHATAKCQGDFPNALPLEESGLAEEWEWDAVPEVSVTQATGLDDMARLFNAYSPRFVASIISGGGPETFERFYQALEAPYVCNGFTRWVDGQWAWLRPELGLTNWERGRLLGRSGILSGDDLFSVREVFIDTTGKAPQAR